MGKRTLYHPISLYVIRGAAEYSGYRFGRLRQTHSWPAIKAARYEGTVERWPSDLNPDTVPYDTLKGALQSAFMDDIRVAALKRLKHGRWTVVLEVQIDRELPPNEPLSPALVQE